MQKYIVILIVVFILPFTNVRDAQAQQDLCDVSAGKSVWSPDGDLITFEVHHSITDVDIYTVEPDGNNLVILTADSTLRDRQPVWSPDSEHILFTSERNGTDDIWIMEADGSNPVNLTSDIDGYQSLGQFSPDGMYITFVSTLQDVRDLTETLEFNIWFMEADGSNVVSITVNEPLLLPVWMPDSRNLIFWSANQNAILSANVESLEVTRLTPVFPEGIAWNPDVSPVDGTIAYSNLSGELWLIDSNTENPRRLTNSNDGGIVPRWSNDGEQIVFQHDYGVSIIDSEGNNRRDLTAGDLQAFLIDIEATWSPDDEYIVFTSTRAETELGDIWIMRSDGSEMQNLTCNP